MNKHTKHLIHELVTNNSLSLTTNADVGLMIEEDGNAGINELCYEILNLDELSNTDTLGLIVRKIVKHITIDNSQINDDVYRLIILCHVNMVFASSPFSLLIENGDVLDDLNRVYSSMFNRGQYVPFIESLT